MRRVDLEPIPEHDKLVLRNLLNLYLYDLSEFQDTDVNNHGFFEYRRLDQYCYDDRCHSFYIRVDGRVAGFALIRQEAVGNQRRSVISEFFVMRKYRRTGIGAEAARQLFETFPGSWEVSEIPDNAPSRVFWRTVIHAATSGTYAETVVNGRPVQSFNVPAGP